MRVRNKSLFLVVFSFVILLTVMFFMFFSFKRDTNNVMAENLEDVKVSVIIPVYKSEKFLDGCLKSVTGQTLKNIEIICINDGSPDNCGKILDSWAKKDSRVKVKHLEKNSGTYFARNLGLDCATGQYITFVDSDDTIDRSTIEFCYKLAEKEGADIVIHNIIHSMDRGQKDFICGPSFKCITPNLWACLYKKELLVKNNIRFCDEPRSSQDQAFNMRLFPLAKKIVLKKRDFYHYNTKNPYSIMTTTKNLNHLKNNAETTKIVCDDWKKRDYFKKNEAKVEFLKWWSYIDYEWWRTKSVDKMFVDVIGLDSEIFKEDVLSLLDGKTRNKVYDMLKNSK